ncbi:MAG: hypothetical protein ACOCYO_03460, partial [Bacteroidota bacterium]
AIIQVIPYWFINFDPSMDGPQHLHNSRVLIELLKNNELFQEFYIINPVIVGYWTGHFLLSLFNVMFASHIAENLLISFYLIGLAISFRFLVRSINPKPSHLTVLIIPFSYTFYFLMGYYSFSLSFIFVFIALGYFFRIRNRMTLKTSIVLSLLMLGVFLSHAFVFALFGLSLVLLIIFEFINKNANDITLKKAIRELVRRSLLLFIISLPSIILLVVYINHIVSLDLVSTIPPERIDFNERINLLARIRALIAYHMEKEAYSNYFYWIPIIIAINYAIHKTFLFTKLNVSNNRIVWKYFFTEKYIWAQIALIFLFIYLAFPDRLFAGNLVSRVALFLFYFLIVWVASIPLPKKLSAFLAGLVLVPFIFQSTFRQVIQRELAEYSVDIHTLEQYIEPNSILYPVSKSSNWIDLHFLNYLGVERPIINLGNPQCQGQFPVVWNYKSRPKLMVGNIDVSNFWAVNFTGNENSKVVNVEYVAVYRWGEFQNSEGHAEIKDQLTQHYELVKLSPAENAALFRLKE